MQIVGVAELTHYLKELFTLDPVVSDIWVRGEVSNVSRPSSGHIYWTLKDGSAQLRCVMFRREALFQAVLPENGIELLVHGRLDVYEAAGTYQLYADLLERQGIGLLYAQFDALKRRLEAEGLFAAERKRPLPERATCIGLVTSPSGAVLHDIISVLGRRWPHAELILAPAQVQGKEAAPAICQALAWLSRLPQVQVAILARGGGSIEDLWAFNEESVARSIAACPVPVISAIGHDTDYTIADFVADLRAPTPSAAAELVAPSIEEDRAALASLRFRLAQSVEEQVKAAGERLATQRRQLSLHAPLAEIRRARQQLDDLDGALRYRGQSRREAAGRRLDSLRRQLTLLDPHGTLQRGYAIVRRAGDGALITTPDQVAGGERLHLHLAGGQIDARVLETSGEVERRSAREAVAPKEEVRR